MGNQVARQKAVAEEKRKLKTLQMAMAEKENGLTFPGSEYQGASIEERKEWMGKLLDMSALRLIDVMWPGTHNSATEVIGIPLVTRPFAQCQSLSPYRQLIAGVRLLDLRLRPDRKICHGVLTTYPVQAALDQIKRFLTEAPSEFLILDIRTAFGYDDPPEFDRFLTEQLAEYLIPQDEGLLVKPLRDLLPRRVICIWRPNKDAAPAPGTSLWRSAHIKDDWIDTDLPYTKFLSNLERLRKQPARHSRNYFYRVENTCTPQADNLVVCVKPVSARIQRFARLFLAHAYEQGILDRLQIFSSDFIDADFINVCIGITMARSSSAAETPN